VADVPRIECAEHKVRAINVPWSEPGSRFTALFEALAISWMKEAALSAVARLLGLTWDQVAGIQSRAVERGLRRRESIDARRIGIDETSFQKRHEYVTVVADIESPDLRVLYVADHRRKEALGGYYEQLTDDAKARLESISMDMWEPYIAVTKEQVPGAEDKICFDKYHVASHLGDAVDRVRRAEHRALTGEGDDRLKRTKYLWLQNPANMSEQQWKGEFAALRRSALKTARAWAVKEHAMTLWNYRTRGWARRAWKHLIGWALRTRLEPVKKVGRMLRKYLWGILNAIVHKVTNARMESINARIQWVKRMACGFRNRDRFREAIYFHLGGLDLRPEPLLAHSKS
jgi:transposase